jgi:hypothetical protein
VLAEFMLLGQEFAGLRAEDLSQILEGELDLLDALLVLVVAQVVLGETLVEEADERDLARPEDELLYLDEGQVVGLALLLGLEQPADGRENDLIAVLRGDIAEQTLVDEDVLAIGAVGLGLGELDADLGGEVVDQGRNLLVLLIADQHLQLIVVLLRGLQVVFDLLEELRHLLVVEAVDPRFEASDVLPLDGFGFLEEDEGVLHVDALRELHAQLIDDRVE